MSLAVLHVMKQRRTPTHVILSCTCGWSHQESRRQNALARAAKIRGAYTKHRIDVGDIDTCTLCERVVGEGKGQCAYEGCRGCKIVQGRNQMTAIRGGAEKGSGS